MNLFVSGVKQKDLDVEVFEKKSMVFSNLKKWQSFKKITIVYLENNV